MILIWDKEYNKKKNVSVCHWKSLAGASDSTWTNKSITFDVGLTVQASYRQQLVSAHWQSTTNLSKSVQLPCISNKKRDGDTFVSL